MKKIGLNIINVQIFLEILRKMHNYESFTRLLSGLRPQGSNCMPTARLIIIAFMYILYVYVYSTIISDSCILITAILC